MESVPLPTYLNVVCLVRFTHSDLSGYTHFDTPEYATQMSVLT